MDVLLNELCALAMNIAGAPRVKVTRSELKNGVIRYLSKNASQTKTIDIRYAYLGLDASRPVKFIQDIRRAPEYENHPIFELLPYLSSVALYHILDDAEGKVYLSVTNPEPSFFHDHTALESMERVVDLIRLLLTGYYKECSTGEFGLKDCPGKHAFGEEAIVHVNLSEGAEPASQFLFDTLVQKPRLLGRNGCSYLSLRMWRKSIKPHQLAAFVALKTSPPQSIVDKIAKEIAGSVKQTFGNTFQTVVPVPGGSSGRNNAFSVLLGKAVASLLGLNFAHALISSDKIGTSHPKKSSRLPPFQLREKVRGNVLIVDDVATSGRHIELATMALREACDFCTAVVWISG